MHEITIFKNINTIYQPLHKDVSIAFQRIKSGASKDVVKAIRQQTSKKAQDDIKQNLPSICFSGKFNKRSDADIIEHSGLICLDFDKYDSTTTMQEDKQKFSKDSFVMSVFISPSGNGLKVIIKIPKEADRHKNYFYALKRHFNNPRWDDTSSNVSRVCYESFDPLIYVNMESEVWLTAEEPEYREVNRQIDRPTFAIRDEERIVKILEKWWNRKYPMVNGQRNNNGFIFAMAMNEFGINREVTMATLMEYMEADFDQKEILKIIRSAYDSHPDKFGTKYYEDLEKVAAIRERIVRGEPKKAIIKEFDKEEDIQVLDRVIDSIESDIAENKFWAKSDKGAIKIVPTSFKKFLEDSGFHKFYPHGSENFVFVQVTNNLIDNSTVDKIKDFVLDYLENKEDSSVYDYFASNTKFFKEDFLSMLSPVDVLFINDTNEQAYLYFRNCAVMITKEGATPVDYIDLGGYVWKNQVVSRDYIGCDFTGCDFQKFITNICFNDPDRLMSVETTIGFLMHGYKDPSYCPAVILNDEIISDNPEGGTGKGLFMKSIGQIKRVVVLNGKKFSMQQNFPYQLVSADAQVISFDDVNKGFDFENLFSDITEGITLEKKNKDAIFIPFENSPKIVLTTNYAIKGKGNSFERRKWDLEFHNFYRKDFTPRHEFGRTMFSDWDADEWCQFDVYMIACLMKFMRHGLFKSDFVNLNIRQLSVETSHEFIEWCCLVNSNKATEMFDRFNRGDVTYKNQLYEDFTSEYPDYAPKSKFSLSKTQFNRWLHSYCNYKYNFPPKEGRDNSGRWIQIIKPIAQNLKLDL